MTEIDFDKLEKAEAVPNPDSMLETFRAIGYSLETAIADIIDNSITAKSKGVWIDFEWKGKDSWISIRDNGHGMKSDDIIKSMKPGCKNPLHPRESNDLGRYGLGLKTASFSQGRQLTVFSKAEKSDSSYWTWDLDFVKKEKKWLLLKLLPNNNYFSEQLQKSKSGTIVIWNKLDRLVGNTSQNNQEDLKQFLSAMDRVKKHLSIVFHRYLSDSRIKIYYKERELEGWDPFLAKMESTPSASEKLHNGRVIIRGYVLPHKTRLTESQYKEAEGIYGWSGHQGFYIYRNDRLLIFGDWLGIFRKEDHYKLIRISIDLPNDLDNEWQIDIMKSIARPPAFLKEQIRSYAMKVRSRGVEVFRHRGKTVRAHSDREFIPLWIDHKRDNKWFYKINREHPLIKKSVGDDRSIKKAVETILRFIEETIPVKSIYIKESEDSENQGKPFEGINHNEIKKLMNELYLNLIEDGYSNDDALSVILNIEPFNIFPHYLISAQE